MLTVMEASSETYSMLRAVQQVVSTRRAHGSAPGRIIGFDPLTQKLPFLGRDGGPQYLQIQTPHR
jgi:hypothetical protein